MGQSVIFQHTEGQSWKLGKVTDIIGPNTYQVSGPNGGRYRKNRVQLRATKIKPKVCDLSPVIPPHAFEVPPFTMPVEYPQACCTSKDPPVENCQPLWERELHLETVLDSH